MAGSTEEAEMVAALIAAALFAAIYAVVEFLSKITKDDDGRE